MSTKAEKPKGNGRFRKLDRTNSSSNVDRVLSKEDTKHKSLRSRATARRVKMYNHKIQRDKDGNFLSGFLMSQDRSHKARIQPDRRWFGTQLGAS